MTVFQIEVRAVAERYDVQAQQLARQILHLPRTHLPSLAPLSTISTPFNPLSLLTIRTAQLYRLTGNLTSNQLDQLISQLLVDPVTQQATYSTEDDSISDDLPKDTPASHDLHTNIVDVFFHPGVTDTLAESVLAGAHMLGITTLEQVETGQRYRLDNQLTQDEVRTIAKLLLYNPVIQHYVLLGTDENVGSPPAADQSAVATINRALRKMSDAQLLDLSKQGMLALNLDEMRSIRQHYQEQRREPTDVELETLAQTWSEHCSHKTFKATIHYREQDSADNVLEEETISGLLKQYLMRATESIHPSWLVSAFRDNAGIIRFTPSYDIAFKVETHNHPSAIEPFGGANTGVGGVIRDVLGVSAQPIACTDILCFGPLDTPVEDLPSGVLSPRRIANGVVNGVRDYGNKMGIPTVNGAILYDEGYIYNPLVFCGCLGLLPHGSHPHTVQSGDKIVVLGGRTGRDGIHGATFSSGEMSSEIHAQAGSAVQIGAPITEKKVTDVTLQARDRQLYSAITDCGAGGFSSAIGEMAAETGAHVELAHAPLKYQGLAPWEIWLSEAQERMVLAVPPQHIEELLAICAIEEVEASILGTFTNDHRLIVTYNSQTVADIDMEFLHAGRPNRTLEAVWVRNDGEILQPSAAPGRGQASPLLYTKDEYEPEYSRGNRKGRLASRPTSFPSPQTVLLSLLGHPTIASKESVIRRYDHEVQGATVLKPLVGQAGNGPGDAAVLQPILNEQSAAGIVISNGINPLYGKIDPYHMAMNAVDEALRNLTAVGGDIERTAILDNFCWGNPTDPIQLGMLVRAVKGCHDAAVGFGTPFISGKDSLNNEYRRDGQRLPVISTLLISAVSVIDDAAHTIDMSLKAPGNLLYQIGTTRNELAGSHYMEIIEQEPAQTQATHQTDQQYQYSNGLTSPPYTERFSMDVEAGAVGSGVGPLAGAFRPHHPYDHSTLPPYWSYVPHVDIAHARALMRALSKAIGNGLICACHDLSEGGLAVAAAEMSLAGPLGMTIDVSKITIGAPLSNSRPGDADITLSSEVINTILLFSESPSRFLVEIAPAQQDAFEAQMQALGVADFVYLGRVNETNRFVIRNGDEMLIDLPVSELQEVWKGESA